MSVITFYFVCQGMTRVTEEQIDKLYIEANQGGTVMHLMWVLWSIVQSYFNSDSSFDYMEYGIIRYQHYKTLKSKFCE